MVDDADYPAVVHFKWHALKCKRRFYAARNVYTPEGKRTLLLLHRFLLPGVKLIDHRDGDGLNNRRRNIRPATRSQNQQATCYKRRGTSRFRGVNRRSGRNTWVARLQLPTGRLYLGDFDSEIAAAKAYDRAAIRYCGEFASPNFS